MNNIFPEFQNLLKLPLTKTTRLGHIQFFHFGKAHVKNSSGLILDVGAWTLEVASFWELAEAGAIRIAYHEVEIPGAANAFSDPAFDPQVPGNNLRDRKLQELTKQQNVRIWQVTASAEGDVTISLEGNRMLSIKPSQGVLETAEYFWRLFSNTETKEAIAFGPNGVIRN